MTSYTPCFGKRVYKPDLTYAGIFNIELLQISQVIRVLKTAKIQFGGGLHSRKQNILNMLEAKQNNMIRDGTKLIYASEEWIKSINSALFSLRRKYLEQGVHDSATECVVALLCEKHVCECVKTYYHNPTFLWNTDSTTGPEITDV